MVSGDDVQTETVLSCNALPCLGDLLSHRKMAVRKECCWALSNICAGNQDQKQRLVDQGLFSRISQMLLDEHEGKDVKKEAAWILHNVVDDGSRDQIRHVVERKGVNAIFASLC